MEDKTEQVQRTNPWKSYVFLISWQKSEEKYNKSDSFPLVSNRRRSKLSKTQYEIGADVSSGTGGLFRGGDEKAAAHSLIISPSPFSPTQPPRAWVEAFGKWDQWDVKIHFYIEPEFGMPQSSENLKHLSSTDDI